MEAMPAPLQLCSGKPAILWGMWAALALNLHLFSVGLLLGPQLTPAL